MIEVTAPDGRTLRAYDVPVDDPVLTVVWHHGTPNVGTPPEPLLARERRARHPLGVLRPPRLRRLDTPPRPRRRLRGR